MATYDELARRRMAERGLQLGRKVSDPFMERLKENIEIANRPASMSSQDRPKASPFVPLFGEETPERQTPLTQMQAPRREVPTPTPAASSVKYEGPGAPISAIGRNVTAADLGTQVKQVRPEAFSEQNIAQARAAAQKPTGINFGVSPEVMDALRRRNEIGRKRAFQEAGEEYIPPGERRESGTMEGAIQAPTFQQAMRDFAAGKVGSQGYGAIRNLLVGVPESEISRSKRGDISRQALRGPAALELAGQLGGQEAGTPSATAPDIKDAIAMLNLQRGLSKDERDALIQQASFGLDVKGEERAARKETREREAQLLEQAPVYAQQLAELNPNLAPISQDLITHGATLGFSGEQTINLTGQALERMLVERGPAKGFAEILSGEGPEFERYQEEPKEVQQRLYAQARTELQRRLNEAAQ